jgi:ribulose bisphosphate carboxylase small subunit
MPPHTKMKIRNETITITVKENKGQVTLVLHQGYVPEKVVQIEHKIPFKTMYLLGVRGLTISSYVMYDYTISGHMDLLSL